ncbi:beta-ketoacyl synthase, C-terminal domain protein, partial [Vibrio parahaemolyticus V-223/04]
MPLVNAKALVNQ